jgi:hypothetical protein
MFVGFGRIRGSEEPGRKRVAGAVEYGGPRRRSRRADRRDVLVTGDELAGLMAELVAPDGPATGKVRLSEWLADHAGDVGREYASELGRHYR